MTSAALKRVVRRETHSPRTAITVVLLVLLSGAAVYAGIEIIRHLLGATALLAAPGAVLRWVSELPEARPQGPVIAGGGAIGLIGVVLLWFALSPGRRPKHVLGISEHAVVADNGVIASAVAERVRRELDLPRGAVVVGIGHRAADVTVRPEPGQEIERSEVRAIAQTELSSYVTSPTLRVRARVPRRAGEGADS